VLFNPVVQQLVINQNFDAWQTANAFAILNVVMVDTMIACWDAKYAYNQWRPITGIRNAPVGSHPSVKADPGWAPLLFTPPYPDYPADHTAVTYAAMNTMLVLFGSSPGSFSVVAGGKSRQYTSFDTIAEEVVNARVYGGVHWRSSGLAGAQLGQDVSNYILEVQEQY
jgi:membrane-associated phospholipid phosphatase